MERRPEVQIILSNRMANTSDRVFIAQNWFVFMNSMVHANPFLREGKASGNPFFVKDVVSSLDPFY